MTDDKALVASDIFRELNIADLADSMEHAENVARWLRRLGDAGTWFMGDVAGYCYEHPEILFDASDDRPADLKRKDIVAHLAAAYGYSTRSIYNWRSIAARWPDWERRKAAFPTIFVHALSMGKNPDAWVDRAIAEGWSTREMLRAYRQERGEATVGEPLRADVTAQRFTDGIGRHHLDVEPDPPGLFAFDCKGERYRLTLAEVQTKGGDASESSVSGGCCEAP